jgi:xanthine dehydrogenase YagR molybdenum-binding subunit
MKNIGDPLPRADGRDKVTGAARYSYEWPVENVAYGVIATSNIARGRVLEVDAAAALREPGVLAVLTPFNAPRLPGKVERVDPGDREVQVLQDDRILFSNQPVALAVAQTLESATHAALLVRVRAQAEPHTVRIDDEMKNAFGEPVRAGGKVNPPDLLVGDVERGLREAHAKIAATYETPPETHNPMEPHATIARWDGDKLTLWESTQSMFAVKKKLAKAFAIPPENVKVICKFVGGAFGGKGAAWSHVLLAALAARHVQRPVKIALTRPQEFGMVGGRPITRQPVAAGAAKDGALTALRHESWSSTSRFDTFLEPAAMQSRHLYACPNIESKHRLVRLDIGTPTFMRAPGESSGSFALESAMDELAHALGIDPIELRLKNYAEKDPTEGTPFSSKSLRACYQRAAERFGWDKRSKKPRNGMLVGAGMATATYPANMLPAEALARLLPDGTVEVASGTVDIGNGSRTVFRQLAADVLGLPVDRVRFDLGHSDLPEAPRASGSLSSASVGSAVVLACRALLEKTGGSWKTPVEVRVKSEPGPERKTHSTHAFGAQFAEVLVDPDLGMVRVSRMVGAFACGRILNARLARSQLMGGMVWGIGMALHEHSVYDEKLGRIVSRDLADYHVPANKDVMEIEPILVEEEDSAVDPAGVKGMGEIGVCGAAAAIANAVFDATGKRIRALPITPDKLL